MTFKTRRALPDPPSRLLFALVVSATICGAGRLAAQEKPRAIFALIVGVNRSADAELPTLRYADDDAARSFELFRSLGAQTYLLTRLDENTRRLHPQASAEGLEPTGKSFQGVVERLRVDIAQARQRQVETLFYFVYAGHGNVKNGHGYISLEDERLSGSQLADSLVSRVGADQVHFIVDSCFSFYLAYPRGPGGRRRPLRGFSQMEKLLSFPQVGLLLSTSSARESHEWEALQAGVFSHEVRSGLYGAADADGDGRVSYREIAAFVERANAAIPNERFRSEVYARPPRQSEVLMDIRQALQHRLEIQGADGAHYLLEDSRGVRLADFHNGPTQDIALVRPGAGGGLFLRRESDQQEYEIPASPEVIQLASLSPQNARIAERGAAHESFRLLFALPFDRSSVERVDLGRLEAGLLEVAQGLARPGEWRVTTAWASLGLSALSLGTGAAFQLIARHARADLSDRSSQQEANDTNHRIERHNLASWIALGVASGTVLTSVLLFLWPERTPDIGVAVRGDGALFSLQARY